MGKSRRKHSREFKIEAVKQVIVHGRSVAEVAAGLGVNANMLSHWKTQLEAEGAVAFPGNGKASATDEEVRRLRRELATAQMERDISKKGSPDITVGASTPGPRRRLPASKARAAMSREGKLEPLARHAPCALPASAAAATLDGVARASAPCPDEGCGRYLRKTLSFLAWDQEAATAAG